MIHDLKPYSAYKESGVLWLGDVPEHWEVWRIRNTAEMRVSNVDKHTRDDEVPVRLCNYVDVYKHGSSLFGVGNLPPGTTSCGRQDAQAAGFVDQPSSILCQRCCPTRCLLLRILS